MTSGRATSRALRAKLLRRDRGFAPKETVFFVIALALPIIALVMLFNSARGTYGNMLGGGPNLADQRLIEQRRLQLTGSISDKPLPLLDLSYVSTGLWVGQAAPAAESEVPPEVRVSAPRAGKSPASSDGAPKQKAAVQEKTETPSKKALFELEAGSTLAPVGPVVAAKLDLAAVPVQPCTGAQGPCECSGRAGSAASLAVLGSVPETGAGGRAPSCTCGPGAATRGQDDPAYLALGLGDRFFEPETDREALKPPRRKLLEILARSPLKMWTRIDAVPKGVKRWEYLRAGDYLVVRQTSRISTDYDGSALPPKGLWDNRYKPETALTLVNKDAARTAVFAKDPANKRRLEKALASPDSQACDFNQRNLYVERKVEVGAAVSPSSRERYVVVSEALDELLAKELGVKWGAQPGQQRPALGATAIVSDPRSGLSHVAVVADVVARDASGQVSAGLREAFADSLKIGGALEDRKDAIDTVYLVHDPGKGGSPISDTAQLTDLEEIVDRQATDLLPTLLAQIAEWSQGGK
ncbi:MAG: hypothetical protein QM765_44080 [Myxococcales bacterium]